MPVHLNVVVTFTEGKGKEVKELFEECAAKVRQEPGCIKYVMAKDISTGLGFQVFVLLSYF
jgi:quinol monooxygenase YgiN